MDSGTFEIISIIAFSLAGVSFGIAVYLFFSHNIIAVVGDISGKTAQKQIEAIREQNAQSGDKRYRPGFINLGRGKITEKVVQTNGMKGNGKTGPSSRLRQAAPSAPSAHSQETEVIKVSEDSEVLTENTDVLLNLYSQVVTDATEVLTGQPASDATEVLTGQTVADPTEVLTNDKSLAAPDATEVLTSHGEGTPKADKLSAVTDRLSRTELLTDQTEVLLYNTEILPKEPAAEPEKQDGQAKAFVVTEKTMLVHTDEVIE